MNRRTALLLFTGLAFASNSAFAQFYQYTDKSGNVVFTDKPPAGSDVKEKRLKENGIYRSNRGAATDYPAVEKKEASPGAKEERNKDYSKVAVVMYMTDW